MIYDIIKEDHNTIKLATSASNATNGTAVNITNVGSGSSHTLNAMLNLFAKQLTSRCGVFDANQYLLQKINVLFSYLMIICKGN